MEIHVAHETSNHGYDVYDFVITKFGQVKQTH